MVRHSNLGSPVFTLDEKSRSGQVVAGILQELVSNHMPIPHASSNNGCFTLVWTKGDITLSLDIDLKGDLEFECSERCRDEEGDVIGTELSRGFLTDPSAVDQLMVVLHRPDAHEA